MLLESETARKLAFSARDMICCIGNLQDVRVTSLALIYLDMGALTITSTSVYQPRAAVLISCIDNTGIVVCAVSLQARSSHMVQTACCAYRSHIFFSLCGCGV